MVCTRPLDLHARRVRWAGLRPGTADEVREALDFARRQPVGLAVRSGGHGISGRSTNDGGVVVDLGKLDRVEVLDASRVRIGAGARWGDVAQALFPRGLAISSGDYGDVGVGGLATAGGIGFLGRRFGLTLDSLTAAELILADGAAVRTDPDHDPDLFWGYAGRAVTSGSSRRSSSTRTEILEQQRLVRWHLMSLARLTDHRGQAQPPDPAWRRHDGWDHRWAMAILAGPGEALWVGAPNDARGRITSDMQRYPRFEDVPQHGSIDAYDTGRFTAREFTEEWWPRAHEAWQRITAAGLPLLRVSGAGWAEYWQDYQIDGLAPHGRMRYGRLSTDWHGLLELQRRLIEPYIQQAAAFSVEVDRDHRSILPGEAATVPTLEWDQALVLRERRLWRSILAPVYLQLLEALRRVSEGNSGATSCRECGQPFLTLDARRSTFCTDRERLRHAQRDRRKRLVTPRSKAADMETP